MRVLSLFDGVSTGRLALERAGVPVSAYYASEVCPRALRVSEANWPDVTQLGDVRLAEPPPDIDLLLAAPPCQGLSSAGRGAGLSDPRSALFWDAVRVLRACRPRWFLFESTARMRAESRAVITAALGVEPLSFNSRLVSAQNRPRLYWTNIPGTCAPADRGITLTSVVGPHEGVWVFPRWNMGGVTRYVGDKAPCVTTSNWQSNYRVQVTPDTRRNFTPEECERLQTFPPDYTSAAGCKTHRYTLLGNAWTVDAIAHLLHGLGATPHAPDQGA